MKHEANEQKALVQFLKLKKLLFTSTLGGVRLSIGQAVQLKSLGYSKGVPDILIFEPRGTYHGMAIELKRPKIKGKNKGILSPEQSEWIDSLNRKGYYACVCHGAEVAIEVINRYLNA